MKTAEQKFDWMSAALTVALHLLVGLILWLVCFAIPERQEESGVPVVMGDMGNLDTDYDFTEIESVASASQTPVSDVRNEPLVTQTLEETVALEDGEERVDREERIDNEEQQRVADEADRLMRNLFGQAAETSTSSENESSDLQGVAGSPEGNATQGKVTGTGGFGTFDLGGRGVDENGLQRPAYTVQDEGRVVVTITVNPAGKVIATSINKRTNTMNATLRAAAEEAARKTVFAAVNGPDNQTGTITYYFKLR